MKIVFIFCALLYSGFLFAQNLGIGTNTPAEKLDVNGNIKVGGVILKTGGNPFDFLKKNNVSGQVGFRKGFGGLGLSYIICVVGCNFPSETFMNEGPFFGEIKLFAGNFAPNGWMFCEGQSLLSSQHPALRAIIGTQYGGNSTTFMLPDLRSAVAIGTGTNPSGYNWDPGQKSN